MAQTKLSVDDPSLLQAALEGLEMQKARIEAQIAEIRSLLGKKASISRSNSPTPALTSASRRDLSPAARKRIADAQKKRWAEFRKKKQQGK